jgi:hypothetical protein
VSNAKCELAMAHEERTLVNEAKRLVIRAYFEASLQPIRQSGVHAC